jgi:hypothetical protein
MDEKKTEQDEELVGGNEAFEEVQHESDSNASTLSSYKTIGEEDGEGDAESMEDEE